MSIADKLTYLNGTKEAIKQAIIDKGVEVSDTDTFRSYADKIGDISGGGEPVVQKKYNVSIGDLLGNVDANGLYSHPDEPFTPDFTGMVTLPAQAFSYKFFKTGVIGDIVIPVETLNGNQIFQSAFQNTNITSISFPNLTTISGGSVLYSMCANAKELVSISFPALTSITGDNVMANVFSGSSKLAEASLPSLQSIKGAMGYCFASCPIETFSFPALQEVTGIAFLNNIFNNCKLLLDIHFPAAMQARIEELTGYTNKFGATNATIYFDL